jgi:beta-barrel assembly-enhancing protease
MKYSRGDEAQADAVGAIILYRAGYNPRALADFFEKLERQGGGGGPQFLSDHPNPGNRQAAIEKEVSNWPPKNYVSNSQAFVRAKKDAISVKAYTGEQIAEGSKQGLWAQQNRQGGVIPPNLPKTSSQGATTGNLAKVSFPQIRPSRNLTQLQHSAFSISYPENWQVSGNRQSTVTIAPQSGVGEGAIAYGVVIGGAQDPNAGSLDEATADLVQTLQSSNPGLRLSGDTQNIDVNGLPGRSVVLAGASPIQQGGEALRERDWVVTVPRRQGGLLYLVLIAPEKDFPELRSTYERMLDTLQVQ